MASVAIVGLFAYRQGGRETAATVCLACATDSGVVDGQRAADRPLATPRAHAALPRLLRADLEVLLNGDLVAFPLTVGVASLIVQTHFGYVVLVTALSMVGIAGVIWTLAAPNPR